MVTSEGEETVELKAWQTTCVTECSSTVRISEITTEKQLMKSVKNKINLEKNRVQTYQCYIWNVNLFDYLSSPLHVLCKHYLPFNITNSLCAHTVTFITVTSFELIHTQMSQMKTSNRVEGLIQVGWNAEQMCFWFVCSLTCCMFLLLLFFVLLATSRCFLYIKRHKNKSWPEGNIQSHSRCFRSPGYKLGEEH